MRGIGKARRDGSIRIYGAYLTPRRIFEEYIAPFIRGMLWNYIWVDMFAGQGDLILPLLEMIPRRLRPRFFEEHVYLFDIQESMVEEAVRRAEHLGVPRRTAERNIVVRDSLGDYPSFLLKLGLPVYHVTNPPYLYIGYIKKHREARRRYLAYFAGENRGYQDLYQLALINDVRHGVDRMTYLVPSNFLYGYSVSNKIRHDVLEKYLVERAVVFEHGVFSSTGTHVALITLSRKNKAGHSEQVFEGLKIKPIGRVVRRTYRLVPRYYYRAGAEFDLFVEKYRSRNPLRVKYYLYLRDLTGRPGDKCVDVVDANSFSRNERRYRVIQICIDSSMYSLIKSNALFVRTLDTGKSDGRAGLYLVKEVFGADAVVVTGNTYRTHPIQVMLHPSLRLDDQILLRDYFNAVLEYLRKITDSDFMTTYKYSNSPYTRKYLGLTQARRLIETFPILDMSEKDKEELRSRLDKGDVRGVVSLIGKYSEY